MPSPSVCPEGVLTAVLAQFALSDGCVDVRNFNILSRDVLDRCHNYSNLLVYTLSYVIFMHVPAIPITLVSQKVESTPYSAPVGIFFCLRYAVEYPQPLKTDEQLVFAGMLAVFLHLLAEYRIDVGVILPFLFQFRFRPY
jgi:hypothetical protein